MRKFLVGLLLIGVCFSASTKSFAAKEPAIRAPGYSKAYIRDGYQFIQMDVKQQYVPTGSFTFYMDNIAGYSSIDFYGMRVSKGSAPTTMSMQPVMATGETVGSVQVLTSGTDLTDLRSSFYKGTFTVTSSRYVTFSVLIAD